MSDSPSYNKLLSWAEHYPPGIHDVMSLSQYNEGVRALALEAVAEKGRCSFFLPQILGAVNADHPMTQEAGVNALGALVEELLGVLRAVSDNRLRHKGVSDAADAVLEEIAESFVCVVRMDEVKR